jgi:hypothetical protein|nr:MAG TPA: hypothetical protein [Caudoviricetes sp.]
MRRSNPSREHFIKTAMVLKAIATSVIIEITISENHDVALM